MIVVLNNQDLNMVTWEQRVMLGDPKFEGSQDIPELNYAAYAEMLGLEGIRVEKEADIAPALRQAFASRRPVVLDLLSDPSVPPLPPHITLKQAKDFTSSILKGDVNAWDMIKDTYNQVIENFLPHHHHHA
jgi:pyruvate dehydrogenase (quinone)